MRILITGATGFIGSHLIDALDAAGTHQLHALTRKPLTDGDTRASWHVADFLQPSTLDQVLGTVRPEWIFHLAGYSNNGTSFKEPAAAWAGNWQATFNLYESLQRLKLRPRVLLTSSGLIYGQPAAGQPPFAETDALYPVSPYASSKAAADLMSFQVSQQPGLDVLRVRSFNQIGPRQSADYATANFARQIAAVENGTQPQRVIETGDLSGQRDITDVRDMVRAFLLLMEKGISGEAYNAGSGTTYSMQTVLDRMLALSGTTIEVRQRIDPARKVETAVSRADIRKLRDTTGWQPEFTLDRSLTDLLNYWRGRTLPAS